MCVLRNKDENYKKKKKAKLHYLRYLVQYLQYEIWNFEEDCRKWNPKMFR